MKTKKTRLLMSLSILMIGFLLCTSTFNSLNSKASLEETPNSFTIESYERLPWKWNSTEIVSTESTLEVNSPSLAIDSKDKVHIVWEDLTNYAGSGADSDIFYKQYNPQTNSWTTTEVVSTESSTSGGSFYPSLTTDSADNLHVVWEGVEVAGTLSEHQIFYKQRNAFSQSWTTTELVSNDSTDQSSDPSLAVDSVGNIHIVWDDLSDYASSGTDRDIFYKRWDVGLASWTATEVVSTESTLDSFRPSLAVDSADNIHIVWSDWTDYGGDTDGVPDVFYKSLLASSFSWTTTEIVSTESTMWAFIPSIVVDLFDNIHVAWADMTNLDDSGSDTDIFYKYFDSTLSIWSNSELVSSKSSETSLFPSLAIDSVGNIHVSWQGLENIFYNCRIYSSSSWTTTELVSTGYTAISILPSLAVDSIDNIHIAWADFGIFYKILATPPNTPELAAIIPNPTQINLINLDWNDVESATSYYIYRSTSYFWSVEVFSSIATTTDSEYIDIVPSENFYYYRIVANNFAGDSALSNLQYIEVESPILQPPELSFILPNPTEFDSISLTWDVIEDATQYYVYRSTSFIWSVDSLIPLATVDSNSYFDTLPAEGFYFYVVVATNGIINSTISNCEYIHYTIPSLQEFPTISNLILTTFAVLYVIMKIRKKT